MNDPASAVRSESAPAARGALVEHEGPERLVVQRGFFTGPTPRVSDDMYARIAAGRAHRERSTLRLEHGATVHTDTYFGRFPASYFQRWTEVGQVQCVIEYEAAGPARMLLRASDSGGNQRTVDVVDVDGSGTAVLSTTLGEYYDGGSLWAEFRAVGGTLGVARLSWTVAGPSTIRPAAIAICTFNRPDDCAATVAALAGDPGMLDGIDAIYVVDQGTERVDSRAVFTEVAEKLGDKLVYLQQPNLGGAGGFTRGMYEISAVNEHANVILMDDDIVCEPETVVRLNAFANLTTTPVLVGAQMLYLMNPTNLHVSAERADLTKLRAGRWAAGALHDTNMVKKRQNKRVDAEYNAWWTCLIPGEVISAVGLPLPIFFQWDDIEFGIRAAHAGFPTTTLPNAGVWHADFHWKDRDDWARYFSVRNSLITAALRSDFDTANLTKRLGREIAQSVVSMQYGLAHTIVRAIEDFLAGPSILHDGGREVLQSIRAERARYSETKRQPGSSLPGSGPTIVPAGFTPKKNRLDAVLTKRAVYQWFGRTRRDFAQIPASEAHWWHVSLFEKAVVTDASQAGVRIRERDKDTAREVTSRAAKVLRRFRSEAKTVQAQYRDAVPQLTARENWARLFGSDRP